MKEIYLDESEEKLTVDEIQSFEKKIGKIFPNDFKKFLLKSNGGYPREELFTHPFIEINPNTNIEFVQENLNMEILLMRIIYQKNMYHLLELHLAIYC